MAKLAEAVDWIVCFYCIHFWRILQTVKGQLPVLFFSVILVAGFYTVLEILVKLGQSVTNITPHGFLDRWRDLLDQTFTDVDSGLDWVTQHGSILFVLLLIELTLLHKHWGEYFERSQERARLKILGALHTERSKLASALSLAASPQQGDALLLQYRNNCFLSFRTLFEQKGIKNVRVAILEIDPPSGALVVTYKGSGLIVPAGFKLLPPRGAGGRTFASQKMICVPLTRWKHGIEVDPVGAGGKEKLNVIVDVYEPGGSAFKSILCAPILNPVPLANPVGVLCLTSAKRDAFPPNRFYLAELAALFLGPV